MTPLGDPVSEEVRAWLDHLPHLILRLAAKWLDQTQRETAYKDEWVPELTYIPKEDEARPVTRLYHGTRYAIGVLFVGRQIAQSPQHVTVQGSTGSDAAITERLFLMMAERYAKGMAHLTTSQIQ